MRTSRGVLLLVLGLLTVGTPHLFSAIETGPFATGVLFSFDPSVTPDEGGFPDLLGPPDGIYRDLDSGGVSLQFSGTASFDYSVAVPDGTDVILINVVPDIPPVVGFGYDAAPGDLDGDGIADGLLGTAGLLGTNGGFMFYEFASAFQGITNDFILTIDDPNDLDLDAVQIIAPVNAVPEPTTLTLLLSGLGVLGIGVWRRE